MRSLLVSIALAAVLSILGQAPDTAPANQATLAAPDTAGLETGSTVNTLP